MQQIYRRTPMPKCELKLHRCSPVSQEILQVFLTIIFLNVLKKFGIAKFILLKGLPCCQYAMTILIAASSWYDFSLWFCLHLGPLERFYVSDSKNYAFSCHLLIIVLYRGCSEEVQEYWLIGLWLHYRAALNKFIPVFL